MDKETFCKVLSEMIADEEKAAVDYGKMKLEEGIEQAIANIVVEGIQKDESKHAVLLIKLKKEVCYE